MATEARFGYGAAPGGLPRHPEPLIVDQIRRVRRLQARQRVYSVERAPRSEVHGGIALSSAAVAAPSVVRELRAAFTRAGRRNVRGRSGSRRDTPRPDDSCSRHPWPSQRLEAMWPRR